ncbi:glutamate 5-kinase [Cryptococcus depauperatus CBS 7841]|uniref:Glutamate 5-kinase n=1 Tax=Cryptococcus depauperatus CBS 7841 TaxID=1295531 RepID=A0A1E3IA70_9TREE|nr:glutamate 5-kinase [Cryptococcus depauperatus CBS 7841]
MAGKSKSSPLTIVFKLGTSSIVSPTYPFLPHLELLSSVVETVVKLRSLGHRVVLVSSGAIGVGLGRMNKKERGKGLHQKQALAAIGQGRLIALWDNLFSHLDQPTAQILLTRMDISDRTRYLNAQNTFSELLQMGVVPIVNENDTVSVSEIKFGDNDTLSAISSAICHADYLFLLTDVECLYTDNPRNNPDAKPVTIVRDIQKVKQQVSTSTLGTSLGTGGMSTKLIAAELATAAGTTTVIMHSRNVKDAFKVIEVGRGPCRETSVEDVKELENGVLCTRFLRREFALKDRKWWITHGLHSAGSITIDEGAYRAIQRKESGGRLLPAGVLKVVGPFASHQAVKLIVRRRKGGIAGELRDSIDGSLTGSPTPDAASVLTSPTLRSSRSTATGPDTNPLPITLSPQSAVVEPDTPSLQPIRSLTSSVQSLDPLSWSVPSSPTITALAEKLANNTNGALGAAALAGFTAGSMSGDSLGAGNGGDDYEEWEEAEFGKGLTQYNSVEIDRIKGHNSSHIEQILGYNDCEHVVDSITFL